MPVPVLAAAVAIYSPTRNALSARLPLSPAAGVLKSISGDSLPPALRGSTFAGVLVTVFAPLGAPGMEVVLCIAIIPWGGPTPWALGRPWPCRTGRGARALRALPSSLIPHILTL